MSNGANRHIDQDRWGLIPIIRAAYYLRWEVLEFLLERNELSRVEKIEARVRTDRRCQPLHLLALWPRVLYGKFSEASGYWRNSLHLRSIFDTDGCGTIMKTPPKNPKNGFLVEWATLEDLRDVIQHRSKQEIHSFLVLSRILSAKSWQALKSFYEEYIF